MFEAADTISLEKVSPGDIQKVIKSLKLGKVHGIESTSVPFKKATCTHHIYFNHCIRSSHFPKSPKYINIITLPKPLRGPNIFSDVHVKTHLFTTGN